LWTRFKKYNTTKQHEQDNRPDESPPVVVVQEDGNAEPVHADVHADVDADVDVDVDADVDADVDVDVDADVDVDVDADVDVDVDVDADADADVDYLQLADEKGREAKVAMREKNNAEAWELLQQQKIFYNKFSISEGRNESELTALDSSVSKDLANLLRQDKKHKDALVHIIYWVANSKTVTKDQESKLRVYFNRAKLMGPAVDDVMDYCLGDEGKEFHVVQKDVDSWV
jgi:hypothetical protein